MLRRKSRAARSRAAVVVAAVIVAALASAIFNPATKFVSSSAQASPIQHIVVLMEENHSFDNYFGTYPGANGIPSGVCLPQQTGACVAPYHLNSPNVSPGFQFPGDLPHIHTAAVADIDHGRMDGFVARLQHGCKCTRTDAAGYFDRTDIPVFWRYADNYTLEDNLFEQVTSWSFPSHVEMVSDWAASCTSPTDPMSCTGTPKMGFPGWKTWPNANTLPWTDLTYLMHTHGVTWKYYNADGTQPVCSMPTSCTMTPTSQGTPIWQDPLPWFTDVQQDGELNNISTQSALFSAIASNTLPEVSWISPDRPQSTHPGTSTNPGGEQFVVSVINAIESSASWPNTVILLAWDDWGGQYDHVVPTAVDSVGYGLRVPGIVISAYSKKGIDHQLMSFDGYNKYIEDTFMGGARLNPATDGRADSRTTVREAGSLLGDLSNDLDFSRPPAAPLLLPTVSLPSVVRAGSTVTVTGQHYLPGDTITLAFNCDIPNCPGGTVGTAAAASDGSFSASVTIPAGSPTGNNIFMSAWGTDALTYYGVSATTVDPAGAMVVTAPGGAGPADD